MRLSSSQIDFVSMEIIVDALNKLPPAQATVALCSPGVTAAATLSLPNSLYMKNSKIREKLHYVRKAEPDRLKI